MKRQQPLSKTSIPALHAHMEKILSGDNDDRLQMEILEANNIILSWQQSHQNKDDIVELIDIKRIKDIMVKGPFPGCKV